MKLLFDVKSAVDCCAFSVRFPGLGQDPTHWRSHQERDRTVHGRPLPDRRSTVSVASIFLLRSVFNPPKVHFLFGNIFNNVSALYCLSCLKTLIALLSSTENGILHDLTYRRLHHNYVTVYKEYINYKQAFANYFLKLVLWSTSARNFIAIDDQHLSEK